jgi:outer membrane protein OmpA-like peptidoglycan-associated protein
MLIHKAERGTRFTRSRPHSGHATNSSVQRCLSRAEKGNIMGRRWIALLAVSLSVGLAASCASKVEKAELITGSDICNGEASQVYFPSYSDSIDVNGAQVVNGLVDPLKVCSSKKITLLAVSGNDGAASQELLTTRANLVRRLLVERGIDESRLSVVTTGKLVEQAPSAPIGRVYVMAK